MERVKHDVHCMVPEELNRRLDFAAREAISSRSALVRAILTASLPEIPLAATVPDQ